MKRLLTIVLVLGLAGPALAQPDGMSDEGTARLADRAEQGGTGDGAPLAVSEEHVGQRSDGGVDPDSGWDVHDGLHGFGCR